MTSKESVRARHQQLQQEAKVMKSLACAEGRRLLRGRAVGIPKLYWIGTEGDFNIIVMELLGKNLEELFKGSTSRFTKKTSLLLSEQIVTVSTL